MYPNMFYCVRKMILNKINRLIKYKDQRNVRDRCK